jgi:hypothetical protein
MQKYNPANWSPELKQSVHVERYWHLCLTQCKGLPVSSLILHHTQKAVGLPPTLQLTQAQVITSSREAVSQRRLAQASHQQLRETYLEQLARTIVLHKSPQLDDPHKEKVLKRRTTEAIKRILKKE